MHKSASCELETFSVLYTIAHHVQRLQLARHVWPLRLLLTGYSYHV